jgi:hypothetical protein
VSKRPLKPDEPELLEETKDYVFYPVLVRTHELAAASGASASILPEQAAVGGSSIFPPPENIAVGGSSSDPKGKSNVASARRSPSPQTGSPADPSKKRPATDSSGGKSKRSKRGRFAGALKSKLLSPPTHQVVTRGDDTDVTTLAPS